MAEMNETTNKEVKKETGRAPVAKKPVITEELNSNTLVKVKNNIPGILVFINKKNGNKTKWGSQGEIQLLPLSELIDLRNQSINFFKNQFIIIDGVAESERVEATIEEIYRYLGVEHLYRNMLDLTDYRAICDWSVDEIHTRVKALSAKVKENLVPTISGYIKDGYLDSRKKIRAFEEALGCEFEK